jgi:uncharacterized protein (DUF2132 family)
LSRAGDHSAVQAEDGKEYIMRQQKAKDPLHGITLETMLTRLVEQYGWEAMGRLIDIRCFHNFPSIKSSLQFLRRTPWARAKVERLYLRLVASAPLPGKEHA